MEEFRIINPDAYKLKTSFDSYPYKLKTSFDSHPVRDKYIFQFSSYQEWKKYQKWLNNEVPFEKNNNNEKEFADILQADLDAMQEKHIQWLEERKKEFEEQRKKYLKRDEI